MPPRRKPNETGLLALDYEIAQEMALALGRLGRTLERRLEHLAAFDLSLRQGETVDRSARQKLVDEAGRALWNFVVQREACGLRDCALVVREYKVPAEVRARMGAVP